MLLLHRKIRRIGEHHRTAETLEKLRLIPCAVRLLDRHRHIGIGAAQGANKFGKAFAVPHAAIIAGGIYTTQAANRSLFPCRYTPGTL